MATEIRATYPSAKVELIPSSKGRFEVHRDGKPIFEKSKADRHAKPGEIVQLLAGT